MGRNGHWKRKFNLQIDSSRVTRTVSLPFWIDPLSRKVGLSCLQLVDKSKNPSDPYLSELLGYSCAGFERWLPFRFHLSCTGDVHEETNIDRLSCFLLYSIQSHWNYSLRSLLILYNIISFSMKKPCHIFEAHSGRLGIQEMWCMTFMKKASYSI